MGCWLKGWDFVPPFFVPKNSEAREMVKLYRGFEIIYNTPVNLIILWFPGVKSFKRNILPRSSITVDSVTVSGKNN